MEFKAVKFTNKVNPFFVGSQKLPVQEVDGQYKLPSENDILVKVHAAALNPINLIIKNTLSSLFFPWREGF